MKTLRNKVMLIGNAGNQPEIKTFDNNRKMARLSLATSDYFKNAKGERTTETTWHTLVGWGTTAELMERLIQKGTQVAIEGKLVNRSYNDKDGNKKYVTEIQVNDFVLVGSKQ